MVFALASRALRTPAARPLLSQLAGARRGYAEAVSEQLKLSFVPAALSFVQQPGSDASQHPRRFG